MKCQFDRVAEDLGNIVALEHVNLTVPDQDKATLFYVAGLGLTRDPFLMTGVGNMWINLGRGQFHLPTNDAQVLRGHVGIVLPDREALLRRLTRIRKGLEGSCFNFREYDEFVEVTCPWGNRIRCFEPQEKLGRVTLGLSYVEFDVPVGNAEGVRRFYHEIMAARASVSQEQGNRFAQVEVGVDQRLIFRETDRVLPSYDGHHIQIYVANFSGPHARLTDRHLITEESDQHQYRFKSLVDTETGATLFEIEHEVRSMRHPLYMRPLINRNPSQNNLNYAPGYDAWIPGTPPA